MMVVAPEHNGSEMPEEPVKSSWNWQEHIPLAVTALSVLFIGIRLLSISHGDFETADGILQASGTATIVIGALVPTIGFLTFPLGVWFAFLLYEGTIAK